VEAADVFEKFLIISNE